MRETYYVDLIIDPAQREAFDALLRDHAEGTLAEEEGCLLFDFFVDPRDPNHYAVFEVYATGRRSMRTSLRPASAASMAPINR